MSPEVKRQVFDPFFTTRRDQGSTGLGLHIVHNIVTNRLGGRINLETRPGAGRKSGSPCRAKRRLPRNDGCFQNLRLGPVR